MPHEVNEHTCGQMTHCHDAKESRWHRITAIMKFCPQWLPKTWQDAVQWIRRPDKSVRESCEPKLDLVHVWVRHFGGFGSPRPSFCAREKSVGRKAISAQTNKGF